MAATRPLRVAMFGGGTVGGGVYELVKKYHSESMSIVKICVRSLDKPRNFTIDKGLTVFTTDPDDILNDDSIDCVVEVMGGTGLAKNVVETALAKGKSVVTANKALLAEHSGDVQQKLKENPSAKLAWEAAVCGGIPIIQLLQTAYNVSDPIDSVSGICNGTTNYMLTAMKKGSDYATVLKKAQDLGYAEADPTADVEGHDVRAKIALLAQLAFGGRVANVEDIPCLGISQLTPVDFSAAEALNSTIKLIGTASRSESTSVYVTPTMVVNSHALAAIDGVGNAVTVSSKNLGTCTYTGPGAGRYPTANSVVADLVRLHMGTTTSKITEGLLSLDRNYSAAFYVRLSEAGGDVESITAKHGVEIVKKEASWFTTGEVSVTKLAGCCEELGPQTLYMPLLK